MSRSCMPFLRFKEYCDEDIRSKKAKCHRIRICIFWNVFRTVFFTYDWNYPMKLDVAPSHDGTFVCQFLVRKCILILDYQFHSSNMTPCENFLFRWLKISMRETLPKRCQNKSLHFLKCLLFVLNLVLLLKKELLRLFSVPET